MNNYLQTDVYVEIDHNRLVAFSKWVDSYLLTVSFQLL